MYTYEKKKTVNVVVTAAVKTVVVVDVLSSCVRRTRGSVGNSTRRYTSAIKPSAFAGSACGIVCPRVIQSGDKMTRERARERQRDKKKEIKRRGGGGRTTRRATRIRCGCATTR